MVYAAVSVSEVYKLRDNKKLRMSSWFVIHSLLYLPVSSSLLSSWNGSSWTVDLVISKAASRQSVTVSRSRLNCPRQLPSRRGSRS